MTKEVLKVAINNKDQGNYTELKYPEKELSEELELKRILYSLAGLYQGWIWGGGNWGWKIYLGL